MINVQLLTMEYGVHEQTTENHDGSHTVFLNTRDSHEMNLKWYQHALDHLGGSDWEKPDVQEIEANRHNI